MAGTSTDVLAPTAEDRRQMHDLYRRGGRERQMAPHIVHHEADCPHPGCGQPMQAIDFRLEDHGRPTRDALVRSWWDDAGFAGKCPHCGGWVHFTIREKRAVTADEAGRYPNLPDNWYEAATIL